jgi:uncharacterized protein (UPF0548 family)
MFTLLAPTPVDVARFLAAQARCELTYPAVGATAHTPPAGYVVDHTRAQLGRGGGVFHGARQALARWEQFRVGWIDVHTDQPPDSRPATGQTVAFIARFAGLWWWNACRVVYVIDEDLGDTSRFGFASGTLPTHAGAGEERFLIEWNRHDDRVWYDILAFSRPRGWLSRLGYPLLRRNQKRFGRDSTAALRRAVVTVRGNAGDSG